MKAPSKSRDRKKYYQFHRDHGHDTEQCIQLRDEIEILIWWGYFGKYRRDPPTQPPVDWWPQPQTEEVINNQPTAGVINMIFGRSNWGATFEEESAKRRWLNNIITFLEEDIWRIQTFHDDAVVVSATIANYDIKKILVDNESSIDVLFYSIFFQMRLPIDRLRRVSTSLVGSTRDAVIVKKKSLSLIAGTEPQQSIVFITLTVVWVPSTYNIILG